MSTATPNWDWSTVLNRATGGNGGAQQIIRGAKNDRVAGAIQAYRTGYSQSLWLNDGQQPSAGVKPGATGSNPDRTTAGAVGQANPTSPNKLYLFTIDYNSKARVTLALADRLMHMSGLSGTAAGAQTIASGSVSRYTGTESAGNEIWLEIYTQIGATPTTITASYTNQAGTAGQTTVAATFGGTDFREVTRFIKLPFQSGDTGVQSVQSVTLAGTTGTAGDFGVTIIRPLSLGDVGTGSTGATKTQSFVPGPIEIKTDACLFIYVMGTSGTAAGPWQTIRMTFIEGTPP
jgi:hypothetical protein